MSNKAEKVLGFNKSNKRHRKRLFAPVSSKKTTVVTQSTVTVEEENVIDLTTLSDSEDERPQKQQKLAAPASSSTASLIKKRVTSANVVPVREKKGKKHQKVEEKKNETRRLKTKDDYLGYIDELEEENKALLEENRSLQQENDRLTEKVRQDRAKNENLQKEVVRTGKNVEELKKLATSVPVLAQVEAKPMSSEHREKLYAFYDKGVSADHAALLEEALFSDKASRETIVAVMKGGVNTYIGYYKALAAASLSSSSLASFSSSSVEATSSSSSSLSVTSINNKKACPKCGTSLACTGSIPSDNDTAVLCRGFVKECFRCNTEASKLCMGAHL